MGVDGAGIVGVARISAAHRSLGGRWWICGLFLLQRPSCWRLGHFVFGETCQL
jgi:hypothetical protein